MKRRNETLQALCREYLLRLKYTAEKHGLGAWIRDTIRANSRKECEATQREVELLGRCVDEERLARAEVPAILGKSYRECNEDNDFDHIKKLRRVGIYSKVSALLYKNKAKHHGKEE